MANTYTLLHVHFVFAVKYSASVIQSEWSERLHKYITGIVQNNGHKMLAVNSVADHLHLFAGFNPNQSISDLMRLVKGDSSEFINQHAFTKRKFHWQSGYGAFSNSHSQIDAVVKYIMNQREHHKKRLSEMNIFKCYQRLALIIVRNISFMISLMIEGSRQGGKIHFNCWGYKQVMPMA